MKRPASHFNNLENATYALLCMLPSVETYSDFRDDMGKGFSEVVPALLDYASDFGLIKEKTEAAFLAFLQANPASSVSVESRTFSDLLAQVLGTKSVNSLLESLNTYAKRFFMMPVQASMFSRLKKDFHPNTPKKRNALRLLAFWLGLKRPELGWNYEMLLKLADTRSTEPLPAEEKEGVRITFALQAAGDILDIKAVEWLKTELRQCLSDLNLHHIEPHRISFTLSTAHVDIPKTPGPSGEPRLYARAVRASLALAYQMPIRWALSDHSSRQRSMIIAVCAGPFDQADKYIQALLSAKKTGITPIRMTEFTRLCTRLSDIKIILHKEAEQLNVGFLDETYINIWHVDYFWSELYYDFVPYFLKKNILPTNQAAYQSFRNELFFPNAASTGNKALSAIRKFPQDALLAMEVTRNLIAKRMFYEADEILSIILASYPLHLVARTSRMILYHYLSTQESDPDISEHLFARAQQEGAFLEAHHGDDAEVQTEIGLIYYARAVKLIAEFRKKKSNLTRKEVIKTASGHLATASRFLNKGAALSPTSEMRAVFLERQSRTLGALLRADEASLMSGKLLTDRFGIIYNISMQSWKTLGWIKDDSPESFQFFIARLHNLMRQFAEDVSVIHLTPGAKCVFAGQLWNILPEINVFVAKLIISLFRESIEDVKRLSTFNIGVYSASGCYTVIQSPAHFIENARKYISILESLLKDDLGKPDDHLIDRKKVQRVALPFALLDDEVESDIILESGIQTEP